MKSNNSTKTLSIIAGKEYQLRVVNLNKDEICQDFFYDTFIKSFAEVSKIVSENSNNIKETSNNIIAFCGERGQGKSSAMLSFSKILKNIDNTNVIGAFPLFSDLCSKYDFCVLNRIDPTELENCHSILSVIMSRIFSEFQNRCNSNINPKDRNDLLELFQKCYRDINIIKDKQAFDKLNYGYEDDLEELLMLSDSAKIKETFYQTVKSFLDFVGNENKNHFLVIQIDDTDLNVSKAYEIVEDIRKYFMIPNVLVLMAVNIDLLTGAIEQNFQKEFSTLINNSSMHSNEAFSMASKYINKLMPGSRRIDLPQIKTNIFDSDWTELVICYKTVEGKTIFEKDNIQDAILKFIYQKTGLIFVKSSNNIHKIIPQNTRELANFLSVLNNMPDLIDDINLQDCDINTVFFGKTEGVSSCIEQIRKRINNLEIFEDYFTNIWIEEKVENPQKKALKTWLKSPYDIKNDYMFYYFLNDINLSPKISIKNNNARNLISTEKSRDVFGDNHYNFSAILPQIDDLEIQLPTQETNNFTFALKTLYSIMINKWYCNQIIAELTDDTTLEDTSIADFVGDILYRNINDYIPKVRGTKSRVSVEAELLVEDIDVHCFNGSNKFANACVLSLFGDLSFYDNPERQSIPYNFSATKPIVRFVQPIGFLSKISVFDNTITGKSLLNEIFYERCTCFQIISNIEVLEMLTKVLSRKKYINPYAYHADYYTLVYERIENILRENLNYIPYNSWSLGWLINITKQAKNWIDIIFKSETIERSQKSRIFETIDMMNPIKEAHDYDTIMRALDKTLRLFYMINREFSMIDVQFERTELEEIRNNLKGKTDFAESTYVKYKRRINKMIKSAKDKLSEYA